MARIVKTEVKFKISKREAWLIRKKLEEVDAWPQKQLEITSVFDDDNFSFLESGQALRKRIIYLKNSRVKDLLFLNSVSLDFKGSLENEDFNEREEISILLDDFRDSPALFSLLLKLGYKCVLIYEAERENWLGLELKFGVKVSIDKLSDLGYFLEIEGEKERIGKMIDILGPKRKKNIQKATYQLYGEFLKKRGKSFAGAHIFKLKSN